MMFSERMPSVDGWLWQLFPVLGLVAVVMMAFVQSSFFIGPTRHLLPCLPCTQNHSAFGRRFPKQLHKHRHHQGPTTWTDSGFDDDLREAKG